MRRRAPAAPKHLTKVTVRWYRFRAGKLPLAYLPFSFLNFLGFLRLFYNGCGNLNRDLGEAQKKVACPADLGSGTSG